MFLVKMAMRVMYTLFQEKNMSSSSAPRVVNLVWDGGESVKIPVRKGRPKEGQMVGTPGERLSELAGRGCYDSLGKGRGSDKYHKHILKVGHYSIYEHYNFTVQIRSKPSNILPSIINRPGIWVERPNPEYVRITYNPRVVLDWEKFPEFKTSKGTKPSLDNILKYWAYVQMPQVVTRPTACFYPGYEDSILNISKLVEPESENEKWVSLFMTGSRGMSHEQVRHGDFTAISQRSTRFIDEAETPWCRHPLIEKFVSETMTNSLPDDKKAQEEYWARYHGMDTIVREDTRLIEQAQCLYTDAVFVLQEYLVSEGADKITARKQARGAARGYLGNALYTDMIFSANIAQWKRMIFMRMSDPADAEIRLVYNRVFEVLQGSAYREHFQLETRQAKDGMGYVV